MIECAAEVELFFRGPETALMAGVFDEVPFAQLACVANPYFLVAEYEGVDSESDFGWEAEEWYVGVTDHAVVWTSFRGGLEGGGMRGIGIPFLLKSWWFTSTYFE